MPSISKRGIDMPSSPIRKLVPIADDAKERGINVYHLNIGQPDILTPKVAIDAIKNLDRDILEYSHSAGLIEYREKLVKYYAKFDIDVKKDEIMVTTGGSEAFMFAFFCCFNPGDEIIIPEPFYANYSGFATAMGINIKPITSKFEEGFALPPIEEFEKLITSKTKGIFICNPNNPTGYLYSEEELNQLREIVLKHDLYLLSDEVYREFCYDDYTHISALNLEGLDDNVVLIDSVSKRYSECGIRVGALVSRNKQVIDAAMKYAQARLSPPLLGQIAACASLDASEEYTQTVYNEYLGRRNVLVEGLNKIPGVKSMVPKGAFYTMAKLPVEDSDHFCAWILGEFSYENQTVMMAPGSGFYSSRYLGKDEVRIAYVLNEEDLKKALIVIEKALEVYPGRKQ
ncbi:pyridoxal phosphate-dependent aminotransferase [Plebeiibacterium marinum]|uniref:Pyridoxal phosphate-dependent aminotransferase n=1 Tax=Plebeiibacterium marinum TaxID=2992111 RepID=A0AAE3SKS3_9BACT|nr:pyridoxal phosphate-dependent aminotransferase [Plebeiobacterium marinum]MCW3806828.1 pyridoxal phosphate-dependent aminotransferase [Plebeiobacterium marinum]